jgi:penicillin-binding protein 1A
MRFPAPCNDFREDTIEMSAFKPRTRDGNFLFSVILTTAKMLFIVVLILGITGTGVLVGVAKAWIETAPALDLSSFNEQAKTSFIYDKYGTLITDFKGTENRIDATWEEIPENLKNAVIAVEDQRFRSHNGVDIKRIMGALVTNLLNDNVQGGSTITQQLVKLTMLNSDQNYKRKLQEAYLALQLEKQISKDDILLEYLNIIFLGGNDYGVKVAAMDYFGKDVSQLSLRECAALARTIRNPYRYNPRRNYYTTNTPDTIEDGADYVLGLMYEQNLINKDQYDEAMSQKLNVKQQSAYSTKMYSDAYYVEYAIYDVVTKMLRVEKLDDTTANRSQMENKLRTGGYSIYTSLDPKVQDAVQDVVTNWDQYPDTRYASDRTLKSSLGDGQYIQVVEPQAAAAVMDWHTGELVAIIGGRSTPTQMKQLNRAYQNSMPVGSSLKPLSVYGPAFDLGYSPGTPVINAPLKIDGWDTDKGYPANFSGEGYSGVETLRKAINKSHNTAAAQTLYTYVGIENSVNYLLKLGVARSHISATGAGLALGASGVSAIEMAAAFGAIANKGEYQEPYAFTRVVDSQGQVYLNARNLQLKRQAFKETTAWLLVSVLKGCVGEGGTGQKANFGGFTVAGKTGTNSDYRGVFFAGMTGYYSGAVWIGHDNYKPLVSNAQGGTYAAPLWAAIMKTVHSQEGITKNREINTKTAAELGIVKAQACAVSGMKPTAACKKDVNGYGITTDFYVKGTEPTEPCNMHRTIRLCNKSKMLPGPYCTSIGTYGTIYLPEGHPLRYCDIKEVRKYFKGASTDKGSAAFAVCNKCRPSGGSQEASTDEAKLQKAIDKASGLIDTAQALIDGGNLTNSQATKLQKSMSNTQNAIDDANYSNIVKYGKQLQELIAKYS